MANGIFSLPLYPKLKNSELIIYEKEIDNYMDSNIIAKLFYFSNDIIDIHYLKQ